MYNIKNEIMKCVLNFGKIALNHYLYKNRRR